MTLFSSDLAYMTADSDGTVRLNRGTTPQTPIPHPSFVGDVRFYRGLAADVGQGQLLGWALVGEISEGTLIRCATADAGVGVISGTNTITPTGTVNAAHDHGGTIAAGTPARTVTDDGTSQVSVSDDNHTHPISGALGTPLAITADAITLNPQAISFWLIEFVGL